MANIRFELQYMLEKFIRDFFAILAGMSIFNQGTPLSWEQLAPALSTAGMIALYRLVRCLGGLDPWIMAKEIKTTEANDAPVIGGTVQQVDAVGYEIETKEPLGLSPNR